MKITMFKSLWGMEEDTLEAQLSRIASSGLYQGIEAGVPGPSEAERFKAALEQHQLDYIAIIYTHGPDHLDSFRRQAEEAARYNPRLIVSQSLTDRAGEAEQEAFFGGAAAFQRELDASIAHETHRGRAMFTPWATADILRKFPELRVTADFSHFCCVCESLLEGQEADLQTIIDRTVHIHARVGYAEGPQVPHPAAPEYARELAVHERWWGQMLSARAARGFESITVTPEYGPPGYLHTLPFTNRPAADLWDVCAWAAERFRLMAR